jgi:hypothetical protein
MVEHKVETGEIQRPPGLPTVELLGRHEILEVFVVGPYLYLVFRAFHEMPPFL